MSDAKFADGCVTISGPENKLAREWYEKNKIPVFAYSGLARGFMAGLFKSSEPEMAKEKLDGPGMLGYFCENNLERLRRCEQLAEKKGVSVAQIAMAWIYNQPFEVYALSSPVTKNQIEENTAALDIDLTPDEVQWLDLLK